MRRKSRPMINHFTQPSDSLRSVIAKDVLLQATAIIDVNPDMLLWMPNGTIFSKGTSKMCSPNPRRTLAVVFEPLASRRIWSNHD